MLMICMDYILCDTTEKPSEVEGFFDEFSEKIS